MRVDAVHSSVCASLSRPGQARNFTGATHMPPALTKRKLRGAGFCLLVLVGDSRDLNLPQKTGTQAHNHTPRVGLYALRRGFDSPHNLPTSSVSSPRKRHPRSIPRPPDMLPFSGSWFQTQACPGKETRVNLHPGQITQYRRNPAHLVLSSMSYRPVSRRILRGYLN